MTKHCTHCHRRWSVSVMDKQEHYICPDCERREKEWDRQARESAKNITRVYAGGGNHDHSKRNTEEYSP